MRMKEKFDPKKAARTVIPVEEFTKRLEKKSQDSKPFEGQSQMVSREDLDARRRENDVTKRLQASSNAEVINFDKVKVQRDAEKIAAQMDSGLVSGEGALFSWQQAAEVAHSVDDMGKAQEAYEGLSDLAVQDSMISRYEMKELIKLLGQHAADPEHFDPPYILAISREYLRRYNVLRKA